MPFAELAEQVKSLSDEDRTRLSELLSKDEVTEKNSVFNSRF